MANRCDRILGGGVWVLKLAYLDCIGSTSVCFLSKLRELYPKKVNSTIIMP